MTPKQPPLFNGRISWFRYEDAVDGWVTLTSVEKPEKWGPLLRSRLIDDAAIYRNMLDPALLQDPVNGVEYFKKTLRPYFVNGSTNVFLYRLLSFFNCHRGNQEFIQFISKFEVNLMRLRNAWMDTMPDPVRTPANYYEKIGRRNAKVAVENAEKRQKFERDMTAARLSGAQLASTGIQDPNIRKSTKNRTFWITELGEFDGEAGFWVEDDENHEMPLEGDEEIFWCLDEHECFALRRVPGRRLKNRPRGYKGGKGRGKGRKRGGFRPYAGAVRRPMWPKSKIRINHTGPGREKEKAKASPRIKVGIMAIKARILENQKMTKEKGNPRPSQQHSRLSLPQSQLPTWRTVQKWPSLGTSGFFGNYCGLCLHRPELGDLWHHFYSQMLPSALKP